MTTRPAPRRPDIPDPLRKILFGVGYVIALTLLTGVGAVRVPEPLRLFFLGGLLGALTFLFVRHTASVQRDVLMTLRRPLGIATLMLALLAMTRALVAWSSPEALFAVPLAMVSLIGRIVWNQRFALELTTYATVLLSVTLFASGVSPALLIPVLIVLYAGALFGAITTGRIRTRTKLVRVGALVGAAQLSVLLCLQGLSGAWDGRGLFFAGVQGVAIGYFLCGSLPLVERLFSALTDISLLELCNQNDQPLLKELLLVAPGTHHHSFVVGVLAEAAAEEVGANPLLCRAGAYYHDVGKMVKPEYFAENQGRGGSPHDTIEPTMSFLIICAHTKDGLEIGRRYGLPPEIMEFIPTHHGTSLVRYFYHRAMTRAGEGDSVAETTFRYPGPKPHTKETGIVNLADAVEAATRSMDEPTPSRIRGKVHEIILSRMMDRQLEETGLTFSDLWRIEEAFVRILTGIFHVRPKYPEIQVA